LHVELLATGDELLTGQIVDTNSAWLMDRLWDLGVMARRKTLVADDRDDLLSAIRETTGRSDLVVMSGGLGPTEDDLTAEVVAAAMGVPLELDLPSLAAELAEALPDGLERRLVEDERDPHGRGHHLGGEVVLGGAEPAAHHHQVGAAGGLADGGEQVVPVVGHERLPPRHDAQVPEPVHEPGRVGVDDLPGQELVARGEQLDVERPRGRRPAHGVSSMHHQ
jgi:molybdenum cofactor synthesis domain-containing protein